MRLLLLLAAVMAQSQEFRHEAIYGPDDRREPHQVRSSRIRGWADSTVALFDSGDVTVDEEKKTAALKTSPFKQAGVKTPGNPWGEFVDLCPGEPYLGQNTGAFCSGSLVAEDLVMTAGHCVKSDEHCKGSIKFVFGFRAGKEGQPPGSVPSDDVYSCASLVDRKLERAGVDYALVKLDRAPKGRTPLRIRRTGKPPVGAPLTVIGHPVGLPTKISGGASIRKNDEGGYLVGNLDTYGGNSGSAVINTVTGEVEGILVRGETDFVYDEKNKCAKSVRKMDDTGRGEDVTLVENLKDSIPDAHKPKPLKLDNVKMPGGVHD
ncbi:MAG: serine protease [Elusimicrobiota bacterium]